MFTLIGNIVTLSGASMLYQMHKFPRFWPTTTSLPGTHWKQNTGHSSKYRTKQKLNKSQMQIQNDLKIKQNSFLVILNNSNYV